jgi:hypothetical protein
MSGMCKERLGFSAVLILLAALVFASACGPLGGQGTSGGTDRQATAVVQTQVAVIVASTLTIRAELENAVNATLAALATSTPAFTFTPSPTFTPTFTLTPIYPTISVSLDTNCRSGPTSNYDRLGLLKVGEKAEVVGRSEISDSLLIRLPSNPSISCWLWTKFASVSGDISPLPVIPIPASPTPNFTSTPRVFFDVSYVAVYLCDDAYRIKFKIVNTGSLTWESNQVRATDLKNNVTKTITYDDFPYYSPKCVDNVDQNLEKGETGYTTSDGFAANVKGHSLSATIQICSVDGMNGFCQEETITFTP